jgi:hypothetical protein
MEKQGVTVGQNALKEDLKISKHISSVFRFGKKLVMRLNLNKSVVLPLNLQI